MPAALVRAGALVISGGVVLLAASSISPRGTQAQTDPPTGSASPALRAAAARKHEPAFLGTIEREGVRIEVFVVASGTRFTIRRPDGAIVGEPYLTAEQLRARLPNVDLSSALAEVVVEHDPSGDFVPASPEEGIDQASPSGAWADSPVAESPFGSPVEVPVSDDETGSDDPLDAESPPGPERW